MWRECLSVAPRRLAVQDSGVGARRKKLCEIEVVPEVVPEVTEYALQKGARSRARERQCRRGAPAPSLSRWTARLGLVLPAVSASVVPFAAAERPKARWMALFKEGSRQQHGARMVLVQNVDTIPLHTGSYYPVLSCTVSNPYFPVVCRVER